MEILGNLLMNGGEIQDVSFEKVAAEDVVQVLEQEAQFAFDVDNKKIVFNNGNGVGVVASEAYVDAMLTTGMAPPKEFDASTAGAFPTENAKHIVVIGGIVQGVLLQANDYLVPRSTTPTSEASSWFVVQGNLDRANSSEVKIGTDGIKYVTSDTLAKHYAQKDSVAQQIASAIQRFSAYILLEKNTWQVVNHNLNLESPDNIVLTAWKNGQIVNLGNVETIDSNNIRIRANLNTQIKINIIGI